MVDHTENILEAKDISFSYNEQDDVLHGITLAVHRGDYVGFVGPNGAGKTTLLKIMLHLLVPKSGTVQIFGEDIREFTQWHRIGYVPQTAAHFDVHFPASVYEVVMMGRYGGRKLFQRMTGTDREVVRDALLKVNMLEHENRLIGDLSGGQQQRVFIARALVNHPEILFLDEPTTGVDRITQDSFYALLRVLNSDFGITLVLVSHDIERITQEAMHIACIDRSLIRYLSPEEYLSESKASSIFSRDIKITPHHHT